MGDNANNQDRMPQQSNDAQRAQPDQQNQQGETRQPQQQQNDPQQTQPGQQNQQTDRDRADQGVGADQDDAENGSVEPGRTGDGGAER